jgi:integrase
MLNVVEGIAKRGAPTTAICVRSWCSSIFKYAASKLLVDTGVNPADIIEGVVERPKVKHKTPLTQDQIPELMKKIKASNMGRPRQIAMELLLRLFTRPSELRESEWVEFDFDRCEWVISADKMKMKDAHFVPLPRQAIELLKELKTLVGDSNYLFPNRRSRKRPMSRSTLNFALTSMGYGGQFSSHGFRATASTLLTKLGFHEDVIERQLSHAPRDKVRASYNQYQYAEERRAMLQAWSDFINGLCSDAEQPKVIPIHQQAA